MSWFRDPQLFIGYWGSSYGYRVERIVKKYDVPLRRGDVNFVENLDFCKHFYLGNNKESDYYALKYVIAKDVKEGSFTNVKVVNSQGLVAQWDDSSAYLWTQAEELTSVVKSLQADMKLAEKLQGVEKKKSELVAETSSLNKQLNQVKYDNQALQTLVSDLTTKLEECRGSRGGSTDVQPWMKGDTVPNHWVPLEELDVLNLPKNPVATMEEPSKPKFVEDVTTNVQVHRFYRGTFIVAVNVGELTPDSEKARFDPDIWGLYKNAGVSYAARKPLESEM